MPVGATPWVKWLRQAGVSVLVTKTPSHLVLDVMDGPASDLLEVAGFTRISGERGPAWHSMAIPKVDLTLNTGVETHGLHLTHGFAAQSPRKVALDAPVHGQIQIRA